MSKAAALRLSYDLSVIDRIIPAEIGPYCPSDILKCFKKISSSLNELSKLDFLASELLRKVKSRHDEKSEQRSTEKNLHKRKLVCGAHETLKFVEKEKIRMVIHAKNLDENNIRAASNFHSLQKQCPLLGIPIVEALTRREISRIVKKFPYVSVVGIINSDDFEKDFEEVVKEWKTSSAFRNFHIDQSSLLP